jgi:hypothetical protein
MRTVPFENEATPTYSFSGWYTWTVRLRTTVLHGVP